MHQILNDYRILPQQPLVEYIAQKKMEEVELYESDPYLTPIVEVCEMEVG